MSAGGDGWVEKEATELPGLYPYWYEIRPGNELRDRTGQLFSSVSRLAVLGEELSAVLRLRNVDAALRRLETYVEGYFIRAYEIRERVLGVLAVVTHRRTKDLRRMRDRKAALAQLQEVDPELVSAIEAVLLLLDDDRPVRNIHTHEMYMRLGFYTGSTVFDPQDALMAVDGRERLQLEDWVRPAIRRCAEYYSEKVDMLMEATRRVAVAAARIPALDVGNSTEDSS